jgi:hypothetical protein
MQSARAISKISPGETGRLIQATRSDRPGAVDPLRYPAWDSLIAGYAGSSFFHGSAWARVLRDTYGHRPFYLCQFGRDHLEASLPIMEVSSPLTGKRGVSLPFTDFCTPLKPTGKTARRLYEAALELGSERRWRYLECRGNDEQWSGSVPSLGFYNHVLDLRCGPDALFKNLEGAVRRGIRKAEREGLKIELGTGPEAIRTYYRLHCQTRHRHGLPPQPFRFFENIGRHVLGAGQGFVSIARLEQRPVAAAVFFHQNGQGIYKFGASDYAFQHLRPNNFMMWESIKRCFASGLLELHLGRTSLSNEGLRRFKLGFGAREETLEYHKYDFAKRTFVTQVDRAEGWLNHVLRFLPPPLLRLSGAILYPHLS